MRKNSGFGLIEIVIGLGLSSLFVLLFISFSNFISTTESHINNVSNLDQIKQTILSAILNDNVFANTIADTNNTSMACLRSGTACRVGVDGGLFRLSDSSHVIVDPLTSPNSGLQQSGAVCQAFDSNAVNPECPYRFLLTWTPQCPSPQTSCVNPLIKISVQLQLPTATESSVNQSRFNVTLYKQLKINIYPVEISAGSTSVCAVMSNNKAKCFGYGGWGALGYGDQNNRGDVAGSMGSNLPFIDFGARTPRYILGSCQTSCALLDDGSVKCSGVSYGPGRAPPGGGPPTIITSFTSVTPLPGPVSQLTRGDDSYAVLINGQVYYWGIWWTGMYFGNGNASATDPNMLVQMPLPPGLTATQVSLGWYSLCILTSDGAVRCAGDNSVGESGAGPMNLGNWGWGTPVAHDISPPNSWPPVLLPDAAIAVYGGGLHNCAILKTSREAYCWGDDRYGQLGVSPVTNNYVDGGPLDPITSATPGRQVIDMALGKFQTCALYADQSADCWGLGFGSPGAPTHLTFPGRKIKKIVSSGEYYNFCVLLDNNQVNCWNATTSVNPSAYLLDYNGWLPTLDWPDINPFVNW